MSEVRHFFSDGLYAKEMRLPKGHMATSHKHKYAHLSILASGVATVKADGHETTYTAPACIDIAAGVNHEITAIEDVTWYCIHATEETEIGLVDEVLIQEG